jgi:hypothetical protein
MYSKNLRLQSPAGRKPGEPVTEHKQKRDTEAGIPHLLALGKQWLAEKIVAE